MSNVIKLLPDTVANQIAAGEVVQRPASVVKELLENAIDATADNIKLIIKDAGKALIQVVDNGIGMNETDARLCFERHATSKISSTDDLFHIHTKGFRGEAMASIAAVAQVELKTRQENSAIGTCIKIEGNKLITQEVCDCPKGTNILVKNLFFNVPARRKFLKSNSTETKHIIDEFERVALAHPEIAFSFYNNNDEVFILPKANFKQRIVQLLGKKYNEQLVPVKEATDVVKITGFIGKPEFAKKSRGEQFFFVNNRFIKSGYLHHAIMTAYEDLVPEKTYPSYFIKLELPPENIDINIHPTKTEIKFDEEQVIYAILRTAVKQAIGKHSLTPTLDFEQETSFNIPLPKNKEDIKTPGITINPNYNPFSKSDRKSKTTGFSNKTKNTEYDWNSFFETAAQDAEKINNEIEIRQSELFENETVNEETGEIGFSGYKIIQIQNKYIVTQLKQGLIFVDIKRAWRSIIYHRILNQTSENNNVARQQLAFPETVELTTKETTVLESLLPTINEMGFDITKFGKNTFIIHAVPVVNTEKDIQYNIQKFIEDFMLQGEVISDSKIEQMAWNFAKNAQLPSSKLNEQEVAFLLDTLFSLPNPNYLPNGKQIIINYSIHEIEKLFN